MIRLALCLALAGCGSPEMVEVQGVVRDGRSGSPIEGARVRGARADATTDAQGRFSIRLPEGNDREIVVRAPGKCGRAPELRVRTGGPPITVHLFDTIEVESEQTQVGFDQEVRLEVRLRCFTAPLRWRQLSGPELELRPERDGQTLVFHTHAIEELVELPDRVGVVPLDRHQRGDYRLEVSGEIGGIEETREVRVVAAPTAAGIFQVPTGADMYLHGPDGGSHAWTLENKPDGSRTELEAGTTRFARLRPDRFGTYLITHMPSGVRMTVQAGAYEDVPMDCGRQGCHRQEERGWRTTAHASAFARGVNGELSESFDERCWSCHATGVDPGIANGGLHQTARRFGWRQPEPSEGLFEQLPRRIRRRGSVWCSACHGPGRIVPPQFHWQYGAKFQVGVCARCHDVDESDPDSNHRSAQVDQWRLSPMSRLSAGPVLEAGCAECHTAQGFVQRLRGEAHPAADELTAVAITCTVCHDPHDGSRPHGLRVHGQSPPIANRELELGSGAICASCHRSGEARAGARDAASHAPQANLLAGTGATLARATHRGPHREVADGCVTCHMAEGDERTGGHTFSARHGDEVHAQACTGCHPGAEPASIGHRDWNGDGQAASVAVELEHSLETLGRRLASAIAAREISDSCHTPHIAAGTRAHLARLHLADAQGRLLGDCDEDGAIRGQERAVTISSLPTKLASAAYDWDLLRTDGSRGVHNPPYAFAIVAALERSLPR